MLFSYSRLFENSFIYKRNSGDEQPSFKSQTFESNGSYRALFIHDLKLKLKLRSNKFS